MPIAAAIVLVLAGIGIVVVPEQAPLSVSLALALSYRPLVAAWRGARGTALRPAVVWAVLAVVLGLVSQGFAWVELLGTGRPWAGHATYLSVLATLAALTTVLNARNPGGGAWALLMALLVLVFLIPWLEGPALARNAQGLGRLRLEAPWSWFYLVVVVAGVTNYVPTRYGPAVAWLGVGFAVEYLALTRAGLRIRRGGTLWSVFPWTQAMALWVAERRSGRAPDAGNALETCWLWFRDHWGVVWALRVQERFNRAAETLGWPFRLGWFGIVRPSGMGTASEVDVPDAAVATLRGLLRRFADPARVDEVVGRGGRETCDPPGLGR